MEDIHELSVFQYNMENSIDSSIAGLRTLNSDIISSKISNLFPKFFSDYQKKYLEADKLAFSLLYNTLKPKG